MTTSPEASGLSPSDERFDSRSAGTRSRLEEVFRRERPAGVAAAYLFGSHAAGRAHAESDVDVGILLERAVSRSSEVRFDARVTLGAWLVGALACNEVDVVILDEAPPLLGREIATNGVRVYCADAERDREFVRDVQRRAADLEPFLRKHARTLLQAVAR